MTGICLWRLTKLFLELQFDQGMTFKATFKVYVFIIFSATKRNLSHLGVNILRSIFIASVNNSHCMCDEDITSSLALF